VKADREPAQNKQPQQLAGRGEPAIYPEGESGRGPASFQPPYHRGPYGDTRDWNWRMERHYADRYYGPQEDIIRYN
jgi:hypothetical protein